MNIDTSGGSVSITPTIFARLLTGQVIKAKDLSISSDQSIVYISCDNINIGVCEVVDERLLISDIYCPSITHYNISHSDKYEKTCTLCGGERNIPKLLSTKDKTGQMVCAIATKFAMYRGIALPYIDESMSSAAGDALLVGLFNMLSGANNENS